MYTMFTCVSNLYKCNWSICMQWRMVCIGETFFSICTKHPAQVPFSVGSRLLSKDEENCLCITMWIDGEMQLPQS